MTSSGESGVTERKVTPMKLLRFALRLDSAASAGLGIVMLALSGKLD